MNRAEAAEMQSQLLPLGFSARVTFDGPKGYVLTVHSEDGRPGAELATKTAAEHLISGLKTRAKKEVTRGR